MSRFVKNLLIFLGISFAFSYEYNVSIAFCEDLGKSEGFVEDIFLDRHEHDSAIVHYSIVRDCFGKIDAIKYKITCEQNRSVVSASIDGSETKIENNRDEKIKEIYFPMKKHKFKDVFFGKNMITRNIV